MKAITADVDRRDGGGRELPVSAAAAVSVLILAWYHKIIAPVLAAHSGWGCRFEPSCSHYARLALLRYGLLRGSYMAARRLARCHPWGGCGYDPVAPITQPGPGSPARAVDFKGPAVDSKGAPWTPDY